MPFYPAPCPPSPLKLRGTSSAGGFELRMKNNRLVYSKILNWTFYIIFLQIPGNRQLN